MPRPRLDAGILLLAAAACSPPGGDAPGPSGGGERPNVLLISIDSLRRDHVGAYGWKNEVNPGQNVTPLFDRIAASGVIFDRAYSTTSWTLPSHMAMLTGMVDPLHGVTSNDRRLNPKIETLAEMLSEAGYATGGFFSGPNLHPAFGFAQGFDVYEDCSQVDTTLDAFRDPRSGELKEAHAASHLTITSPTLFRRSSTWIQEVVAEQKPFFAFVHWWDPHYDYVAPDDVLERFAKPYDGEFRGVHAEENDLDPEPADIDHLLAMYDAETRFTDQHLAKLVKSLEQLGELSNTIVILTSDHGEEFWEHERWGHQRTLYEEVIQIPMVISWAGHIPEGKRVRGQARLQDLLPTIAELLDLPSPEHVSGQSLVPLWTEKDHRGYPQLLSLVVPHNNVRYSGLRWGQYKVLYDHHHGGGRLFDLRADPEERRGKIFRDLETNSDRRVQELRDLLAEIEDLKSRVPPPITGQELPAELLQDLADTGYIGED